MTGLGGAYIASAEGTEGTAVNSAAPAVRDAFSFTWFDFDVMIGAAIPGAFVHSDFDNHGTVCDPSHACAGNFLEGNFGGTLQFGALGVAATGDLLQYDLQASTPNTPGLTMQIGRWKAVGAYGFFDGQLAIGGGLRATTMQILQPGGPGTLLTMTGVAPELGTLVMPDGRQWRLGATLRAPVTGSALGSPGAVAPDGTRSVGSFVLPREVVMPYEAEVGFAYQLGPRPLNPGWPNPHEQEAPVRRRIEHDRDERAASCDRELAALPESKREARRRELEAEERSLRAIEDERLEAEIVRLLRVRRARYENWPREKILLLASVLLTGPSRDAVSVEGFLDQRRELVGKGISLTPRLGIEGEPVNNRLRARIGTYLEPSRYEEGTARQHFTFGGDVKLAPFNFWGMVPETTWKLMLFVDVAPRYTNGGIGIGNWH